MPGSRRRSVGGRSVPLQMSVAAVVGEVERWRGTATAQYDISIVAVGVLVASSQGEPGPSRIDNRKKPKTFQLILWIRATQ